MSEPVEIRVLVAPEVRDFLVQLAGEDSRFFSKRVGELLEKAAHVTKS